MAQNNLTTTERRRLRESHGSDDPMFIAEAEDAMAQAIADLEEPTRTVDEAVDACYEGARADARKRGRNPKWPYVPIVRHGYRPGVPNSRPEGNEEQIRGRAYETRERAVQYAERVIAERRADMARKLRDPRYRAFRAQWRVPEPAEDSPYYMATYEQADEARFTEWQAIAARHGGRAEAIEVEPLPYAARVSNGADAKPQAGDTVIFNRWNRVEAFTARGQHYVGVES